jgi:hypothetical protein
MKPRGRGGRGGRGAHSTRAQLRERHPQTCKERTKMVITMVNGGWSL